MQIISYVLFAAGTFSAVHMGIASWTNRGDDKRGVVALPFALLAAAAVAHYIGA